jgi:hypothetical protein
MKMKLARLIKETRKSRWNELWKWRTVMWHYVDVEKIVA